MFNSSHNVLISGGTFNHVVENRLNVVKGGFERLQDAVAPGAFHNSGERFDPPKCHVNTRVAVLKRLRDWILRQDPDTRDALIMWLYGPAGVGKSAIAQTLADICHSENKLLASFFFSRNDPLRSNARPLVATLAYQLALKLPQQVRDKIVLAIDHDPLIFTLSLEAQLKELIVQPVHRLAESGFFDNPHSPRLIIIDGLDECDDPHGQCSILRAIFQSLQCQSLPLLFLIASRPETDISSCFDSPTITSILTRLGLDDSYGSYDDIRLFLNDKFEDIKRTHKLKNYIPPLWPTEAVVECLVGKSCGQFIYASTAIKFVSSSRHRPTNRLEIILGIRPARGEAPFAELDALYTHIFSRVEDITIVTRIIGILLLRPSAHDPYENLEAFLSLEPGDLSLILCDLGSVLSLDKRPSLNYLVPRILHASLKDFFLDASRSKDLYINPVERHTEYALLCFQHLNNASMNEPILSRLFYHSSCAVVTQELRENILQLSVESILTAVRPRSLWHRDWIAAFFKCLESLTWDPNQKLYRRQLELLDQFFMRHLDIYYSNPFLLLIVAVFPNKDSACPAHHFSFPKAARIINYHRLLLLTGGDERVPEYRKLFTNFVEDSVRSGKYFLDGAKYASAAIVAITYISNHWSHPLPAVHSGPDKHIRQNAPQRWRKKWGRSSVLFMLRTKHKPRPGTPRYRYTHLVPYGRYGFLGQHTYFNARKNPRQKDLHARRIFCFALRNLPFLLKRSGKSKELFDFARQAQFGRRAKSYSKSTRLAKKAIDEYLARYLDEV